MLMPIEMLVPIEIGINMAAGNRKNIWSSLLPEKRFVFSCVFLLILTLFRMLKISGRVILKIRNSSATTVLLISRSMKFGN